eukprot:SAG31_NODE_2772_length_5116_cov_2.136336_3_plen_95_part_00
MTPRLRRHQTLEHIGNTEGEVSRITISSSKLRSSIHKTRVREMFEDIVALQSLKDAEGDAVVEVVVKWHADTLMSEMATTMTTSTSTLVMARAS